MNKQESFCFGLAILVAAGASYAQADSQWFLMSRHGECVDVQSLKRKVPDLGEVRDPDAFIKLMQGKGHKVTVNEMSMPNGKAFEVNVPERELGVIFVTPEVCQHPEAK